MNYYNPYFSSFPYNYTPLNAIGSTSTKSGLFSSLFGGGKLSSFINGTQKTLNIINQAIPIVKQMSPVMRNAKTMFRVMNEFKKVDTPIANNKVEISNTNVLEKKEEEVIEEKPIVTNSNGPTFFL